MKTKDNRRIFIKSSKFINICFQEKISFVLMFRENVENRWKKWDSKGKELMILNLENVATKNKGEMRSRV